MSTVDSIPAGSTALPLDGNGLPEGAEGSIAPPPAGPVPVPVEAPASVAAPVPVDEVATDSALRPHCELGAVPTALRAPAPSTAITRVPPRPTHTQIRQLAGDVADALYNEGARQATDVVYHSPHIPLRNEDDREAFFSALSREIPEEWLSHMMSDAEEVSFRATLERGGLDEADTLYLAVLGAGTGEDLINSVYTHARGMFSGQAITPDHCEDGRPAWQRAADISAAEIDAFTEHVAQFEATWAERYGEERNAETLLEELTEGWRAELGGSDERRFLATRAADPQAAAVISADGYVWDDEEAMGLALASNLYRIDDFVASVDEVYGEDGYLRGLFEEQPGPVGESLVAALNADLTVPERTRAFVEHTLRAYAEGDVDTEYVRAVLNQATHVNTGPLRDTPVELPDDLLQYFSGDRADLATRMVDREVVAAVEAVAAGQNADAGPVLAARLEGMLNPPFENAATTLRLAEEVPRFFDTLSPEQRAALVESYPDLGEALDERFRFVPVSSVQDRVYTSLLRDNPSAGPVLAGRLERMLYPPPIEDPLLAEIVDMPSDAEVADRVTEFLGSLPPNQRAALASSYPGLELTLRNRFGADPALRESVFGAMTSTDPEQPTGRLAAAIDFVHWSTSDFVDLTDDRGVLSAIRQVSWDERSSIPAEYNRVHGEGAFEEAMDGLDRGTQRAINILISTPSTLDGSEGGLDVTDSAEMMRDIVGEARYDTRWARLSANLADSMGRAGPVVDDALRDIILSAQNIEARIADGTLEESHLAEYLQAQRWLERSLVTYGDENEDSAEAISMAVGLTLVTVASFGSAPLMMIPAAGVGSGLASTSAHAALEGPGYTVEEAIWEFVTVTGRDTAGAGLGRLTTVLLTPAR